VWLVDAGKRRPGRGAYLCSARCQAALRKNKRYRGLADAVVELDAWKLDTR